MVGMEGEHDGAIPYPCGDGLCEVLACCDLARVEAVFYGQVSQRMHGLIRWVLFVPRQVRLAWLMNRRTGALTRSGLIWEIFPSCRSWIALAAMCSEISASLAV
jgi:hypothetical protein